MLATVMNSLDTTIANVALPHMARAASRPRQDQITWVLTSYIIAAAIMTPLSGWLSVRIGRKLMFLVSIAGFTVASMLCGVATSLGEIVVFRLLQGLCGAALIPLSQAVVLDIYPPAQVGQVMAIWGAGAILGPIFGPVLGGWLTDNFSWRWVFFINLPIGILAFAGGAGSSCRATAAGTARPFDFLGFGALVVFIGALQLMLDRGPTLDWFSSPEIWIEAICGARRPLGLPGPDADRPASVLRPRPGARPQLRHLQRLRLLHRHPAVLDHGAAAAGDAGADGLLGVRRGPGDDAARPRLVRWPCSSSAGWSGGSTRASS